MSTSSILSASSSSRPACIGVATVLTAEKNLRQGWRVRTLGRPVVQGGTTYVCDLALPTLAGAKEPSVLLLSAGVLRALRYKGLLKGQAGVDDFANDSDD